MSQTSSGRQKTGILGLDNILGGGLPSSAVYLVQGDPGVGKTTLCLQFLLEGVKAGETCLYVTLSESAAELQEIAASHGWSLEGLHVQELSAAEPKIGPEDENTLFHPAEIELGERIQQIVETADRIQPTRIVIDSCSELRLLAQTALRFRRQVLTLKQHLVVQRHSTLLLLDNASARGDDQVLLQSLAHGVINMEQMIPEFGVERRRLVVLKLRGVRFRGGYHDFVIATGGLKVFPRLIAAEHITQFEPDVLSSGVPEFDKLLGGGLTRGSSTLLVGPAGTGKSALGLQYAVAAASRGEHSAVFLFDESRFTTLIRSKSLGMELEPHIQSGCLTLRQVDPAEMSPGEFSHDVRKMVESSGTRVVVLDSLNGYQQAMPNVDFLIAQLHELLTFLGQQGVLTMLLMAQHGLLGDETLNPIDVSYLADTVVVLRYFEASGSIRKAVSVVKRRIGMHEDTIREFKLTSRGIRIGQPLRDFRGVLGGVPEYKGSADRSGPLMMDKE